MRRLSGLAALSMLAASLLGATAEHPAAPAPAPASPVAARGAGAVHARAFTIRYRNPGDVVVLIEPLLSEAGSYTLQPRLHVLTVQDSDEVLSRVADVVRSFDIPPRNVEVTINLLMGSSRQPAEVQSLPREIRGITEVLPDITKWTNYRLLGSVSIVGSEGATTLRTLPGEDARPDVYQVELGVRSVDEESGVIRVDPFTVRKDYRTDAQAPVWRPVYSTKLNLRSNRMLIIAAARNEKSEEALFLTIRARVTE